MALGLHRGRLCAHVSPLAQPLGGDAGGAEHAPEVDDHLLADVLPTRPVERLGLATDSDLELAVVLLAHLADRLQQGEDVTPLDVVADRVGEDRLRRAAMVVIEVGAFNHEDSGSCLAPANASSTSARPQQLYPAIATRFDPENQLAVFDSGETEERWIVTITPARRSSFATHRFLAPDARQLRAWLTPVIGREHAAELAEAVDAEPPATAAWIQYVSDEN